MSRIAEARRALVAALEPVLPGRVDPYEMEALPCIHLGVAVPSRRQSFNTAVFPVIIEYDGADKAQIAGLDEVSAKVCDAIDATKNMRWVSSQPGVDTTDDPQASRTRHVLAITVEVTIGTGSFCAPDVVEAETPPPVIQRIA